MQRGPPLGRRCFVKRRLCALDHTRRREKSFSTVPRATAGPLRGTYGAAMDENERRRLEENLVKEWDKLRDQFHMDDPVWGPLEKALPYKWCGAFMYMGRTEGVHMYKHGFTRHYLNLDDDGNAYRYLPGSNKYVPMNRFEAIENAFEGLALMGIDRSTPYDDAAVRRRHKAIEESGMSLISLGKRDETPDGSGRRRPRKRTRKGK
jgi:hypothetical protein